MSRHYNANNEQLHLNLNRYESPFAEALRTEEVRELIEMLTKERLATRDILNQARNGELQVCYLYGTLRIHPSHKGKSGRLWRWDVI